MKLCIVCSHGGHLNEMLHLIPAFKERNILLVTYREIFTENFEHEFISKKYLIDDLTLKYAHMRDRPFTSSVILLIHMVNLFIIELKIFLQEKPDIIISTGSEIAIPFFLISKIFRRKNIFIESLCRIKELSGAGKIVYPISDVFLVQWPILSKRYDNALYKGNILNIINNNKGVKKENIIFVTVGTAPFDRLIKKIDNIANKIDKKIIMQIGRAKYKPRNAEYFEFVSSFQYIKELNEKAEIVVCHGGVGSILTALESRTPVIAVPRLKKYMEHYDNHQMEIVSLLSKKGIIRAVYDLDELDFLLTNGLFSISNVFSKTVNYNNENLSEYLRNLIINWEI